VKLEGLRRDTLGTFWKNLLTTYYLEGKRERHYQTKGHALMDIAHTAHWKLNNCINPMAENKLKTQETFLLIFLSEVF